MDLLWRGRQTCDHLSTFVGGTGGRTLSTLVLGHKAHAMGSGDACGDSEPGGKKPRRTKLERLEQWALDFVLSYNVANHLDCMCKSKLLGRLHIHFEP